MLFPDVAMGRQQLHLFVPNRYVHSHVHSPANTWGGVELTVSMTGSGSVCFYLQWMGYIYFINVIPALYKH